MVFPDTDTDWPKRSPLARLGLDRVAIRLPVVAAKTYAWRLSAPPVSSNEAPATTAFPDTDIDMPNRSLLAGEALASGIGVPVVALNTYAAPQSCKPPMSAYGMPTT